MINQVKIKKALPLVLPYFTILYYVEIIYLIFILLILFGKTFSIIAGAILSLLLAYHIISLNYMKNMNRKAQLVIMDIHFAYSISFIANLLMIDIPVSGHDIPLIGIRLLLIIVELPMIFYLTDREIAENYR